MPSLPGGLFLPDSLNTKFLPTISYGKPVSTLLKLKLLSMLLKDCQVLPAEGFRRLHWFPKSSLIISLLLSSLPKICLPLFFLILFLKLSIIFEKIVSQNQSFRVFDYQVL